MYKQTKDIPDATILNVLADYQGQWAFWYSNDELGFRKDPNDYHSEQIRINILPPETPHKLFHSKMKSLHKRGLIGGCVCGCRGDFEITDKGLALIGRERTQPYTGY